MSSKLYKRAYKFLKLRSTTGGVAPFKAIEDLNTEDRNKVINFLKYNHQVKFI
jgi:hypothetical protein